MLYLFRCQKRVIWQQISDLLEDDSADDGDYKPSDESSLSEISDDVCYINQTVSSEDNNDDPDETNVSGCRILEPHHKLRWSFHRKQLKAL